MLALKSARYSCLYVIAWSTDRAPLSLMPSKKHNKNANKQVKLPVAALRAMVLSELRSSGGKPKFKNQGKRPSQRVRAGGTSDPAALVKFKAAGTRPFDPRADGARIPDPWAFPTVVMKLHTKTQLIANGQGTTSSMGFVVLPSPFLSLLDLDNLTGNGQAPVVNNQSLYQYTSNNYLYGLTTETQMFSSLRTFRVVGAGWRLRVEIPELLRTGDITIAPLNFSKNFPATGTVENAQFDATSKPAFSLCGGQNPGTLNSASVLQLPGAKQMSLNDMGRCDIELVAKPVSTSYTTFHSSDTNNVYAGSLLIGDQVLVSPNGMSTVVAVNGAEEVDCTGMCGYVIYIDGLTASNAGQAIVSLETIMHVEGSPVLSSLSGSGIQPIPSGQSPATVTRGVFDKVMDFIDSNPGIKTVASAMSNYAISSLSRKGRPSLMN